MTLDEGIPNFDSFHDASQCFYLHEQSKQKNLKIHDHVIPNISKHRRCNARIKIVFYLCFYTCFKIVLVVLITSLFFSIFPSFENHFKSSMHSCINKRSRKVKLAYQPKVHEPYKVLESWLPLGKLLFEILQMRVMGFFCS
jgi:hypothetical protein